MSFKTKWVALQMQKHIQSMPRPPRHEYDNEEDYEMARDHWHQEYFEKRKELWSLEVEDAKAKAYLKAIQDVQAAVIRQKVQAGDFEGMPELEELMGQLKNKRGNGGSLHPHYFVTVNCKRDVLVSELVKKVNKYVKRKLVRSAEWVYEQRGSHEGELGKGVHVHILVSQRGDVFDGEFKRSTRNTFKGLVGNPETHVDIRAVKSSWLEDKRAYMKGAKTEEGKDAKVAMDRVWRPQNNLAEYYTHQNGVQAEGDPPSVQPEAESGSEEQDSESGASTEDAQSVSEA